MKPDIFKAEVEALVNPVNCVGVMGKGLAAQFKALYPENFRVYAIACRLGAVAPGTVRVWETGQHTPRYIVNFPTKRHWRDRSLLGDIEIGLVCLVKEVSRLEIKSIAIPALGCGLGGLSWADVKPLIVSAFAELPQVQVVLFDP